MTENRQTRRIAVLAGITVLLLWGHAGAGHDVTFSRTNDGAGGTAILGLATGGFSSHAPTGIWGEASSNSGRGVFGTATATSGLTYGVFGQSASTSGIGVIGTATAISGTNIGVFGVTSSPDGRGVYGRASVQSITGTAVGVHGESISPSGTGVFGSATAGGTSYGVRGEAASTSGRGVFGSATATSGTAFGVYGQSASTSGRGVYGFATAISGTTSGVYGRADSPDGRGIFGIGFNGALAGKFNGNVQITGNLTVSGTKSFALPHPTQRGKEIVYIALEGPEAGTYIRGTAQLVRGEAVVTLPEHFALVTAPQGLTVQLTPVGGWLQLYVHQQSLRRLIVREAQGKSGRFHYLVQGIRRGHTWHQVIRTRRPASLALAIRGR